MTESLSDSAAPTILIVDDMPANLGMIVESLEQRGYKVLMARGWEEGLQRATFMPPDLILLDITLPGLGGIEICGRLKRQPETRDIPVIFMTSLTDIRPKVEGFHAGAVDYITKPLQIEEVAARVGLHLQLHAMQSQLADQNAQLHRYQDTLEQQVDERTAALSSANHQLRQEIAERKRIETALRQGEQQYRTLAEHVPDVIVRYDRECRRVFVNPAYSRAHGTPEGTAQGKKPEEVWKVINISPQEYQDVLRRVMETGESADMLVEYEGRDGKLVSDHVRAVAEYDDAGRISGVLAIGHNITSLKRQERLEKIRLRIFELLAHGGELTEVLDLVIAYVEAAQPDFLGSVMLVTPDGKHLASANGTHLPADYLAAIDGMEIAEGVGSCGTAAWSGEAVIVEDINTHPYWQPYKHLALAADLQACWSWPIHDSTGNILGTFGIYLRQPGRPGEEDLDLLRQAGHMAAIAIEHKRAEEQLWQSERKYRTLVEDSPDVFIRYDLECRRVYLSESYMQVNGEQARAALGKKPTEYWSIARQSAQDFEQRILEVIRTGKRAEIELDWYTPAGEYICYWMRAVPEYDRDGKIVSVLSISRDVSEFKRAEKALHRHEQELRSLVENTPDTITRYDRNCRRIYVNPKMMEDLGGSREQTLNKTPSEYPGGESALAYEERIRQVLENGQPEDFELAWKSGDGKQVVSHIRLAPEFDAEGQVVSVLAVGRDITEIDEYRQSIHHLAFYDALTDLPNRSLLIDRIRQTIADAAWHSQQFGLMMLDLDRFKEVNDTLGHGVGDLLLRQAAERLTLSVRAYDTVARLGGDEFAILLPDVRAGSDLATIGNKVIEAFQQPFNVSGKELFVSTSIGIALYPGDSAEIDSLFRYADSAMYHAKKLGRNNCQFYSKELTARSSERMALETALRRARRNRELELYYQPQIDLASKRLVGAEALLRWNHKEYGVVTPDRFIPVAEDSGLIVGMGEWILESACRTSAAWNKDRKEPLQVSVNLSTRQFIQNDLLSSVRHILAATQCKPEWLKLEITESLLLDDSTEILDILTQFDSMGLALSIDDFGTGYSALSYLNRFPVSQIKIDRSFVRDIPGDEDKAELVKAIISIAQALHLEVIAEGVETHAQADYLLANGCRMVQGYLFGKPMRLVEFEAFCQQHRTAISAAYP